jgi:hypothetical protein
MLATGCLLREPARYTPRRSTCGVHGAVTFTGDAIGERIRLPQFSLRTATFIFESLSLAQLQ